MTQRRLTTADLIRAMGGEPHIEYCARVWCQYGCHGVLLSKDDYLDQMARPNESWKCPKCGFEADFDYDYYDAKLEMRK